MDVLRSLALLAFYQSAALHDEDPFALERARLYDLSETGQLRLLLEPLDVYIGFAAIPCIQHTIGDSPFIVLETGGWAAPLSMVSSSDVPPSEQEARRRVRVVMVGDREGQIASAISFADEPEEVICNVEEGEGPLVDAFREALHLLNRAQRRAPKI